MEQPSAVNSPWPTLWGQLFVAHFHVVNSMLGQLYTGLSWVVEGGTACELVPAMPLGFFPFLFFLGGWWVRWCCFLNCRTYGHDVSPAPHPPQPSATGNTGSQQSPPTAVLLPHLHKAHSSTISGEAVGTWWAVEGSRPAACSLASWAKPSCSSLLPPCIPLAC